MSWRASTAPVARVCYRIANLLITADRAVRRSRGRGVKILVENDSGQVLLVRHTYGKRHWTFPGGRVHSDETTATAARRELEEELALSPPALRRLGSYPVEFRRRSEVIEVFLVERPDSTAERDPVEIAAFAWHSPSELPEDLDPQVRLGLGLLAGRRAEQAAASRGRSG